MKRILIVMMAISFGLIYSCKKDNPVHQAFIGANINGSPEVGKPSSAYTTNKDSLQIKGAFGTQNIVMSIRFAGTGKYPLNKKQAAYFTQSMLPVQSAYLLDTAKNNTIIIGEYNPYLNVASGTFELHFLNGNQATAFTNGQFWMPVLPAN